MGFAPINKCPMKRQTSAKINNNLPFGLGHFTDRDAKLNIITMNSYRAYWPHYLSTIFITFELRKFLMKRARKNKNNTNFLV
ncbi:hypothetical protein DP157_07770 [Klebsiella michiganensis]|nr:hypothetical protein [Klebsiella michiganensis]